MIRRILGALAALSLGLALWSGWQNRAPHEDADIAMLADRLFTFGAISFVHDAYDGPDQGLFDCVVKGFQLTPAQSMRYRMRYQAYLLSRQSLFVNLDQDLVLKRDFGSTKDNNIQTTGIPGLHDQHDLSAMGNLADIAASLNKLSTDGPIGRIAAANNAHKDLTDLMVHMAPAIHSVGLLRAESIPADVPTPINTAFTQFYLGMKTAQATAINSPAYWASVKTALDGYATLTREIQNAVWATNGPIMHAVSGRWLSLQTVAPRLSEKSAGTQSRRTTAQRCNA